MTLFDGKRQENRTHRGGNHGCLSDCFAPDVVGFPARRGSGIDESTRVDLHATIDPAAVLVVLRARADAQVLSAIIQPVSVDVINDHVFTGAKQEPVKITECPIHDASVCRDAPSPGRQDGLNIGRINTRTSAVASEPVGDDQPSRIAIDHHVLLSTRPAYVPVASVLPLVMTITHAVSVMLSTAVFDITDSHLASEVVSNTNMSHEIELDV